MPVIINEIEVMEQPPGEAAPSTQLTTRPPAPVIHEHAVVRLVRDTARREERRVAD
jgi:hypothetical protein